MTDTPEQARIRAALEAWNDDYYRTEYRRTELADACNPAAMAAMLAHMDEQEGRLAGYIEQAADDLAMIVQQTAEIASLQTALAECREALPIPEEGAALEADWAQAMSEPEGVPPYIKAVFEAQAAEIERLTVHLKRANEQTERFERDWYLRGDEIERLKANGWIPVGTRLPLEDDGEVLLLMADGSCEIGWATYWHGASRDFSCWTFRDPDFDRTPTHWMPIPAMEEQP